MACDARYVTQEGDARFMMHAVYIQWFVELAVRTQRSMRNNQQTACNSATHIVNAKFKSRLSDDYKGTCAPSASSMIYDTPRMMWDG